MSNYTVCVGGQKQNGKTTISRYIVNKLNEIQNNQNWKVDSFAFGVKNLFMKLFSKDEMFVEEWKTKNESAPGLIIPVRKALQIIGDSMRQIDPNVWVNDCLGRKFPKVCDDCRYYNEAETIKKNKGFNLLLYREGFLNDDIHPSEAEIRPVVEWAKNNLDTGLINLNKYLEYPEKLKLFDFFIRNDKDLNNLYNIVDIKLLPFLRSYFGYE